MATIDLGKIKQVFRGTYNNATAYAVDDLVAFTDGSVTSTYICTTASTGNNPSSGGTAHANWAYVAKGASDSPTTTQGDIIVRGASSDGRLAIGAAGKALKVNASANGLEYGTAGRILQVVVNEKSGVTSISGQNNNNTFADVTGYTATITPTAASSKILVQYTIGKYAHNGNTTAFRFTRSVAGGSATAIKIGDADGNRPRISFARTYTINNNHSESFHYQFLDTPSYSVGQAIVYQLQCVSESSNSVYFNRSITDDNETYNYRGRAFSTITSMEVSA